MTLSAAPVSPYSSAPTTTPIQAPAAAAPNATPSAVSSQELAYWSQQTNILLDTPEKQEKAKAALEEMRPYMRMEITDPRFIEHAKHMGIDVDSVVGQLQGASGQLQQMEQTATQLGKQLEADKKSARTQVLVGGGAGIAAGVAAGWFSAKKWPMIAEKLSGWKKGLAVTGIGVAATVVVSALYDALLNGGNKNRIRQNEQQLDTMVGTYAQSAEQVGNYVNEVRNVFVTTHLQRSLAEKPKTPEQTPAHNQPHVAAANASYSQQLQTPPSDMQSAPVTHEAPAVHQVHHNMVEHPVHQEHATLHHDHQNPHEQRHDQNSAPATPHQPVAHIQPHTTAPTTPAAGFAANHAPASSYAESIRREPGSEMAMGA